MENLTFAVPTLFGLEGLCADEMRRLGLPQAIIDKAAERIDAENVRFEDVLTQLDRQRQEMEREKDAARRLRREMEDSARTAREYRERLKKEERERLRQAPKQGQNRGGR